MFSHVRAIALGACVAGAGCAVPGSVPPAPASAASSPAPRHVTEARATPPQGSYWQDVAFSVAPGPASRVVPLAPDELAVLAIAQAQLGPRPAEAEEALRKAGVVVLPATDHQVSMGAFYTHLLEAGVPYVVTMDALFGVARAAVDAALEEADRRVTMPDLAALLGAMAAALERERVASRPDTVAACDMLRAVVAVARGLLDPATPPPADLAAEVKDELARVNAHVGIGPSPVLRRPVDYAVFDAQRGLLGTDPRVGAFRAITYLAQAAMELAPRPGARAPVTVEQMRTFTRAAMTASRLLHAGGDATATAAWERLDDLRTFAEGPADDLGPRDLWRVAASLGVDLRDGESVVDVARVDRLRRGAARNAAGSRVDDLGVRAPAGTLDSPLVVFRVLGPSAPPDVLALARLTGPRLGALRGDRPTATAQGGVRALPTALDVAAAFGSSAARDALHEAGDDAYEGFDGALADARRALPAASGARHRSLYLSFLDAIATYLQPSVADATQPAAGSVAEARRRVNAALVAWATLRHDTAPLSRDAARDVAEEDPPPPVAGPPAMVEPHPETIARLLALVRQTSRGLRAHRALSDDGPAAALLARAESVLADALAVAVTETDGRKLTTTQQRAVWAMPAELAGIEQRLGVGLGAPRIATVHVDVPSGRALQVGTGFVRREWLALRAPGTTSAEAFAGAFVPQYEVADTLRWTDVAWARRLIEAPPPEPAYTRVLAL